jgi:hypothetical protein
MEQLSCRLISINAFHQSEEDGDEFFLKIGKTEVWPATETYLKVAQPSTCLDLAFDGFAAGEVIELQLWEYDSFISKACLGMFRIKINARGGPFTSKSNVRKFTQIIH